MSKYEGGWIGVDFDGTLADYSGFNEELGRPVPAMVARIKQWLSENVEVKIVTARAGDSHQVSRVQAWCSKHLGAELPVTNKKDYLMIALFDDRAVQVKVNTGKLAIEARDEEWRTHLKKLGIALPALHTIEANLSDPLEGILA